jgi:hypothetical protein
VLIDTSQIRDIDRIDDPSQSMARIWTRLAVGSLFIAPVYELLCLASSIFMGFTKHNGSAINTAVGLPRDSRAHVKPLHPARGGRLYYFARAVPVSLATARATLLIMPTPFTDSTIGKPHLTQPWLVVKPLTILCITMCLHFWIAHAIRWDVTAI